MRLTIEKLIYGGDGLARLAANDHGPGKAAFIPFTLPGEEVEATLTEEKPGFARAALQEVIRADPRRISPRCPYFIECGGCDYQHTTYEQQLRFKAEILRENLLRLAKIELPQELKVHSSPPWEYRNRSRFQIRTSPETTVGYYRFGSHEVLQIEKCPISSPLINRALSALHFFCRTTPPPLGVTEIELFTDADDEHLLIELMCLRQCDSHELRSWAQGLKDAVPDALGIVAFTHREPSSKDEKESGSLRSIFSLGEERLIYRSAQGSYRVSAGAFFQVNRHLVNGLVDIVTRDQRGETAVDLYAGVGLFTVPLARSFRHIRAVESSPISHLDLLYNSPENVKAVRTTTDKFLEQAIRKPAPDLVVVDPPRSGLRQRGSRWLGQWQPRRITYVSCDPATLARDLVPLMAARYRIAEVHLVDLFPQTYHIETVVHLVR